MRPTEITHWNKNFRLGRLSRFDIIKNPRQNELQIQKTITDTNNF